VRMKEEKSQCVLVGSVNPVQGPEGKGDPGKRKDERKNQLKISFREKPDLTFGQWT